MGWPRPSFLGNPTCWWYGFLTSRFCTRTLLSITPFVALLALWRTYDNQTDVFAKWEVQGDSTTWDGMIGTEQLGEHLDMRWTCRSPLLNRDSRALFGRSPQTVWLTRWKWAPCGCCTTGQRGGGRTEFLGRGFHGPGLTVLCRIGLCPAAQWCPSAPPSWPCRWDRGRYRHQGPEWTVLALWLVRRAREKTADGRLSRWRAPQKTRGGNRQNDMLRHLEADVRRPNKKNLIPLLTLMLKSGSFARLG